MNAASARTRCAHPRGAALVPAAGGRPRRPAAGFTLIELLVVIAIIAMLAALVLAGATQAIDAAYRVTCLSNLHQLQTAWQAHAHGEGRLPTQYGDFTEPAQLGSWIVGDARTDVADHNLRRGSLFPYTGNTAVYRCPADRSTLTTSDGTFPKNRTYSLSSGLVKKGIKLPSQIDRPSTTFVFAEEAHVDDGVLVILGPPQLNWQSDDYPAQNHPALYQLSFADGHAQATAWVDPASAIPWGPGGEDLANLQRMLPLQAR